MHKFIEGIRTIKATVWEAPMLAQLSRARAFEKRTFLNFYLVSSIIDTVMQNPTVLLWLPTVLIQAHQAGGLEAGPLFASLFMLSCLSNVGITYLFLSVKYCFLFGAVTSRFQEALLLP